MQDGRRLVVPQAEFNIVMMWALHDAPVGFIIFHTYLWVLGLMLATLSVLEEIKHLISCNEATWKLYFYHV